MRQARRSVLEGHRSRQSEGFLSADIRRHPDPADRRPAGDVVDRDHRLEPDRRPVDAKRGEVRLDVGKAMRVSVFGAVNRWLQSPLARDDAIAIAQAG
jgi:hypothetical protein